MIVTIPYQCAFLWIRNSIPLPFRIVFYFNLEIESKVSRSKIFNFQKLEN